MKRFLLSLVAVLAMGAFARAEGPATQPAERLMQLTILDSATHQPLPDVSVRIEASGPGAPKKAEKVTTDAAGVVDVPVRPDWTSLYIQVDTDGHVPRRLLWSIYNNDPAGKPSAMPDQYTMSLEPGTKICGKVIDDAGEPVAGANVVLHLMDDDGRTRKIESLDVSYKTIRTTADGAWSYNKAPATFARAMVGVHHPDYASGPENAGFYGMDDVKDPAALRDGKFTTTLDRGILIEGTVTGADGKPVAGAKVGLGSDRVASNVLPDVKTDVDGHYSMHIHPNAQAVLTVRAKGNSPAVKSVTVAKATTVDFKLEKPSTVRGRVVDPDGKPLEGAYVYFDTWQGFRTINHTARTDKDGNFTWDQAPADKVKADVDMPGFARAGDLWFMPSKDENDVTVVKLRRPLQVSGTVVEAETGEPIKAFTIVSGIWWNNEQAISWERREEPKKGADGKFEYKVTWPYPGYAARIEAPGYLPGESRVFKMEEGSVQLEIKLTRGKDIKGTIRDTAGKPVKVKVIVATGGSGAYIQNGRDLVDQGALSVDTAADGTYSLPAQSGKFTLVVFGDAGYAEVSADDIAKSADITLPPWARVEGDVMIGSKPGANAELAINEAGGGESDRTAPRIFHQQEAHADSSGHFVFNRVRPGEVSVARIIRMGMTSSYNNPVRVTLKAGETTQVKVGGMGRPVTGRIVLPPEVAQRDDWMWGFNSINSDVQYPKREIPDDVKAMDPAAQQKWYAAWQKSPEGQAYQAEFKKVQASAHYYNLAIDSEGRFRVDDMAAGKYKLSVMIAARPKERTCGFGDTLATASFSFTIPDMPTGRSDEVLDIGSIQAETEKHVKVGDVAPGITAKTLDGKDFDLASLKGKYVIVDFWATWCGPCVAEIPNMKSAYEAFAKNDKFAMVSVSFDEKPETAKAYTEKQQMAWQQVWLPGVWENAAAKAWGIRGIPSVWLIGPDGKVLAKDLRGEGVKQALQGYLKD